MRTDPAEDRYDELMRGFYEGVLPSWLPEASRALYERESRRRRCELGQVLVARWPATAFAARALVSDDFAQRVFTTWPAMRFQASNVLTGVYLALEHVLAEQADPSLLDLLRYEALGVAELGCPPRAERIDAALALAHGLGDKEVFRFPTAVVEVHARLAYYATSGAPASFVRDLPVPVRQTLVSRYRTSDGFVVEDVTDAFASDEEEACAR